MALPSNAVGSTNLAQHFIKSRGPEIHQAFKVPSHFNAATSSFELNEVQ
jgi:hypothetical protein